MMLEKPARGGLSVLIRGRGNQTGGSNEDGFNKIRLDPVTPVSARCGSAISNRATAAGDQWFVAARPRAILSDF